MKLCTFPFLQRATINKMDERQQKRILSWLTDINNDEIIDGVEDEDKHAEF